MTIKISGLVRNKRNKICWLKMIYKLKLNLFKKDSLILKIGDYSINLL